MKTIQAKHIPSWKYQGKTYRAICFNELINETENSFVDQEHQKIQALQVKTNNFLHLVIHGTPWKTIEREIVPVEAIKEVKKTGTTKWKSLVIDIAKEKYGLTPNNVR